MKATKTTYFLLLVCLSVLETLNAQPRPTPPPYSGSSVTFNYVRTWEAVKPASDPNDLTPSATPDEARITTQYFDGLGRPLQTVVKQGSLSGGSTPVDMVSTVLYDELGRISYQYLPAPANNAGGNTHVTDGAFKLNPFEQQAAFYSDANGVLKGQSETYFYGRTIYEASPLNRIEETFAPGNSWAGTSENTNENERRSVKTKYRINTAADGVRIWNVTNAATPGDFGSYTSPGAYAAGQLYKSVTVDEHGKQTIEFKDKEGQVVLKKVQLTAIGDDGSGSGHTGWLCTYYIYDDLGQLRCVIQPEGVKAVSGNWQLTDATILAEQCFRYEYDQRQRMIVNKVPGAGEVNMIYDKRDRLVMTRDANQQAASTWLVTKYDVLNRPVETGLWTDSHAAAWHRNQAMSLPEGDYNYPPQTNGNYEMLTQTYYDNYDWSNPFPDADYDDTWDTEMEPASTTVYPYAVANVKSVRTKGMITGSRTKILGTSDYLYTMLLYDDKGRIIQTKSTNATGGTDVLTTQYGWQGLPLIVVQKQQKADANPQTITTVTKSIYDELGRVVKTKQKQAHSEVNGGAMSTYTTISELEYDALGQVKTKTLAPEYDNNAGLENLEYEYNIRGWLLGTNREYITQSSTPADKHFGFDLGYDKNGVMDTYAPQYNGNISGTIWKSAGDEEKRKYDFDYDGVNRITDAYFNQYTDGSFNKTAKVDFSMNGLTYDANGNILTMNQNGLKINSSPPIDQLSYTYQTNSNKLSKVVDGAVDKDSRLGDFKYDPATKGSIDYTYDANGNLISDANKSITDITYNYLNLPVVITVTDKGTITYTYDAAGNKLKKTTVDNTVTPAKTTTTLYIGGALYENDQLQFIAHGEGRIRPLRDGSNNITAFTYDYFLKDHLGNVRMVLTEEEKQDIYPMASLESSKVSIEEGFYTIKTTDIVGKSTATGIPDYPNNNGIPNNPPDPSFEATNSTMLYRLNSSGSKTGLGMALKVMAGDKIDVFGKSYYFQNTTGTSGNSQIPILDLLAGFLGTPLAPGSGHGLTIADLNTPAGILGIQSLITSQGSQSNASPTKPRAFINVIFFDEQFKSYDYRLSMAGSNSVLKDHYSDLQHITAEKSGYVYIYCSNESPVDVFFDNLQVVHTRGPVLEETHYYPFGLTMAGISSKALQFGGAENKYKWNKGSELQNKEFSDGSGLELYVTNFRSLDPQLGRFWQTDPKPDYSQSLYSAMNNNPILYNDPLGDTIRQSFRIGFLGIFGKKVTVTYDEQNQRWNNSNRSAYTGKMTKFSNMVLNDLKMNQKNDLGNTIVTNLSTDTKEHYIKRGDPNSNNLNDPNIYYSGSVSDNQKILQGGKTNSSPSYVVLGHEMAHKFGQNLGIRNFPWFGAGADQRGVDEFNAMYYENVLRQANGLPLRTAYQEANGVTQGDILNAKGNLLPLPPNLSSQSMNLPLYHVLQTFRRLF